MASQLALKRISSTCLRSKLFHPTRSASVFRSFNTNAAQVTDQNDGGDRSIDIDRRDKRSVSRRLDRFPGVSDVFDPFSPTRSLSQVLNLMDQFTEDPFLAASRGAGAGARRGWNVKEDDDALYLRMDMPGLGKENVKVSVEHNTLTIRGEEEEKLEEGESGRKYSSRLDLPSNLYKLDAIKAEMKNGVLKVAVPKVKEEERKNEVEVMID